jgi:hypothetical protein
MVTLYGGSAVWCRPADSSGRGCRLAGISDHLFRYRKRIVDLDAEIPNRAFKLGVAEQELHGPDFTGCGAMSVFRGVRT